MTRTLTLTQDQIDLLTHALGIAEAKFQELSVNISQDTLVRGNNPSSTLNKSRSDIFAYSCAMADLNSKILNGDLDERKL
jgi:hypothetical protein